MRLPYRKFLQTLKPSDAVLQVDNQIVFGEFAEIDLGAVTFGTSKPQKPSRMDCESSEQLRSRENDEIDCRKTKSARQRALDEIDAFDCACHDFAKPLDLAFSLEINCDPCVVRAPFFQALHELCAFCFGEHEIAGAKLSNVAILKRAAEIFRSTFNPAFADLKVWKSELVRARRRWSSDLQWWLDIDDQITLADVIANRRALM